MINQKKADRFWSRVDKSPTCWIWKGARLMNGYGVVSLCGNRLTAHRASWFIAHGNIPPTDIYVCHKCDVKLCVNPDHLFLGTNSENIKDAIKKGRFNPKGMKGESHGRSKLTTVQVQFLRSLPSLYNIRRKLAEKWGVHTSTIRKAYNGRYWKCVEK